MRTSRKSIAVALLVLPLALGAFAAPSARAAETVCGDVNQSGALSTSDALLVLKKAVGQTVGLACPSLAAPLKTGQTTCHNDNGELVSCAASGADGELQRGVDRTFTDNGDGTVTDPKTGLMWEKLSRDDSIHDQDKTYSWADAIDGKIVALNATKFAGHQDWRLPNMSELRTILNLGTSAPVAWAAFHSGCADSCTVLTCACTPNDFLWTSTEYAGNGDSAWSIYFATGQESQIVKTTMQRVRAVRGGY